MPLSSFTVQTYKVKLDQKLAGFGGGLIQIAKRLDVFAATKQHGFNIKGTLIFEGESLPTPLGSFEKQSSNEPDINPKSKFTVTLLEKDFSHVYAVFRTEKPVYILYNADKTFEEAQDLQTVEIKGARIQTDDEDVGEGLDAS